MAKNEYRDWKFVWEVHRTIVRQWFRDCSSQERLALIFIFDRTLGWGKREERVSRKHCVEGVWTESGECVAAPFASNLKRAGDTLNGLVDKGYLVCRDSKLCTDRAKVYSLNRMKMPKRLREDGDESVSMEGDESVSLDGDETGSVIRKSNKREERQSSNSVDAEASEVLVDASSRYKTRVEEVRKRSRSRRKVAADKGVNVRKGSGFVPTKDAFVIRWKELFRTYFRDDKPAPLSSVVRSIMVKYGKAWTQNREEGEFMDYIEFLFRNWLIIRSTSLGWMSDAPRFPVPEMIVSSKLRRIFEVAYANEERMERLSKMDEMERRVEDLREKGMDPDKAKEIVAEEFGYADKLKELRVEREKIKVLRDQMRKEGRIAQRAKPKPKMKNGGGTFADWIDD